MQPASGLPCSTEALMASVSSTSILSRLSLDHTFQARFAIGIAFQNISGALTAATTGLALKAISSDSVGSASGERADSTDASGLAGAASLVEPAHSALTSARLAPLTRASIR